MSQSKKVYYLVNTLSILRIVAIFFLAFLDTLPLFIIVNILFITDFFDGYLARKYSSSSKIGGFLDLIGDKSLVIFLVVLFYTRGELSLIIVLLMTIREIISMVLRFKSLFSQEQKIISPSLVGKSKTALQFIALDLLIIGFPFYEILFWVVIVMAYYSLFTYFKRAGDKDE